MKKSSSFVSDVRVIEPCGHYIQTRTTKLSDIDLSELDDDDSKWREKSRQLQIRRWRKIKNQMGYVSDNRRFKSFQPVSTPLREKFSILDPHVETVDR